jgi:hypothetical protein
LQTYHISIGDLEEWVASTAWTWDETGSFSISRTVQKNGRLRVQVNSWVSRGNQRDLLFLEKHTHTQRKKESEGPTENEGCLRGFHHKSIEREMTPKRVLLWILSCSYLQQSYFLRDTRACWWHLILLFLHIPQLQLSCIVNSKNSNHNHSHDSELWYHSESKEGQKGVNMGQFVSNDWRLYSLHMSITCNKYTFATITLTITLQQSRLPQIH